MITFLIGIAILIGGYFTYGKFVERVFRPDDRQTPATKHPDGVDRMVLPHWKNMLVQLLNIAGIGPVIGVILGIKFGAIVFILLPIGNVFGGAVHDYFSGMISMSNDGMHVPSLARTFLRKGPSKLVMILISVALIFVGAVFTNTPAGLINTPIIVGEGNPSQTIFWIAVAIIFAYYFASTFFPIDKIIGRIYPIFGGLLILASIGILIGIAPEINTLEEFNLPADYSHAFCHYRLRYYQRISQHPKPHCRQNRKIRTHGTPDFLRNDDYRRPYRHDLGCRRNVHLQ